MNEDTSGLVTYPWQKSISAKRQVT